jgi:hypothetical protein
MRITVRRGAEYHQAADWHADEMARAASAVEHFAVTAP